MRELCKWLAIGICGTLALLTVLLALPGLFRVHLMIVQSGSMEPSYPAGSVIYVKKVDEDGLKAGRAVTFWLPDEETLVTHRIVRVREQEGELYLYTKGDANEREDSLATPASRVVGAPFLCVPYLGCLADYLSGAFGKAGILLMVVMVCILSWMDGALAKQEKEAKKG